MRMFDPEGIVGNSVDLARGLQHPAFAPGIDNTVVIGSVGQESQWQFENDRIAILTSPRVLARIHETKISVGVLLEAVAVPGERSWRQLSLDPMAPFRLARVKVEELVALELQKCLWNPELPQIGHRVRHVIKLRGIVDRPKEPRQIIEKGIIPAAYEDFERLATR